MSRMQQSSIKTLISIHPNLIHIYAHKHSITTSLYSQSICKWHHRNPTSKQSVACEQFKREQLKEHYICSFLVRHSFLLHKMTLIKVGTSGRAAPVCRAGFSTIDRIALHHCLPCTISKYSIYNICTYSYCSLFFLLRSCFYCCCCWLCCHSWISIGIQQQQKKNPKKKKYYEA